MPEDAHHYREFGPYQLVRLVGKGGMGEVWEARDTRRANGPLIALKLLPENAVKDEELKARFLRECELAAAVDHPNVLPVYAYGEIDGTPYIAMRLVSGTDLASEIERGPLPPERAVSIVEQVASALDEAHRNDLRHRDVKPSNVMLEPGARRGTDHASLIDWGIAQPINMRGAPVTRRGLIVGSVHYIATERLKAGATNDHRADVYSLAVVLYECLAGQPPFVGTDPEVLSAHLNDKPPPLPDHLPAALRRVVAKGLAKEPQIRYQSAGELAHEARTALPSPSPDPWWWRALVAAGVAGGVLALALALLLLGRGDGGALLWILPVLALAAVGLVYARRPATGGAGSPPTNARPADLTQDVGPGGFP